MAADQKPDAPRDALAALRYCPKLGHDVPLSYCLRPGSDVPCGNIRGCWEGRADIEAVLGKYCTAEQIAAIDAPRPDKAATIVELIQRAREAQKRNEGQ